jgi:hypothetical protein
MTPSSVTASPLVVREYHAGRALCMCGCGLLAPIAKQNYHRLGISNGQPMRYVLHHKKPPRHGRGPSPSPIEDRFWPKVQKSDGCWEWKASKNAAGYGRFSVRLSLDNWATVYAHRFAYTLVVGPIPEGLTLDHLCRNPGCVNPAHLEPVTMRENVMRGNSPIVRQANQTHCIHGHEFAGDNVYIRKDNGARMCRACSARRGRERRQRERS